MKPKREMAIILSAALIFGVISTPIPSVAAGYMLSKSYVTLVKGSSAKLKVTRAGKTVSSGKIIWKSSAPKVASVTMKGMVTAKKAGRATISAKIAKKKLICKVTVKNQEAPEVLSDEF